MVKWNVRRALILTRPGQSFFVPTTQDIKLRQQIKKEAEKLGVRTSVRRLYEHGLVGLRTWVLE